MRRAIALICAALACGGSAAPVAPPSRPAAHETVAARGAHLPGSRVRLTLPDGFVRPSRNPTFVDPKRGITVSLVEMTLKGKDATDAIGGFGESAAQLESRETTPIVRGRARGTLYTGLREGAHMAMLLLQDEPAIGLIIMRYTDASAADARAILDSISLDRDAPFDPLLMQGLSLTSMEGLVVWDVMASPVVLKEPSAQPPIPPTSQTIAISTFPVAKAADADAGLADVLRQSKVKDSTLTRSAIDIDGLHATEVVGEGTKDGVPVTFYGVVAVEDHSAVLAWSEAASSDALARAKRVLHGIRRLPNVMGPVDLH